MTLSNSLLLFEDIQQILDRALESDVGLKVQFDKVGDAIHFRQRCYKFRALVRRELAKLPEDDPARHASIYDSVVVYIRKTTCEIRKRDSIQYRITELTS